MEEYYISFIVPVYNAKLYIENCVGSIQSMNGISCEVILVDDGSTDGSGEICDKLAEENKNVKVIHKSNGGVSSARNIGIKHAKGRWIWFVDADDRIIADSLDTLVQTPLENYDLLIAGYESFDMDGNAVVKVDVHKEEILMPSDAVRLMYNARYYPYLGYPWNKLFRRNIIIDNNLRFNEKIGLDEDCLFCIDYLCHCKGKIFYTTNPIYRYSSNDVFKGNDVKQLLAYIPRLEEELAAFSMMQKSVLVFKDYRLNQVAACATWNSYLHSKKTMRSVGYRNFFLELRMLIRLILSIGISNYLKPSRLLGYN